jgi:hypothetical protein
MMMFFGLASVAGAVFALVLWLTAGRKAQEKSAVLSSERTTST